MGASVHLLIKLGGNIWHNNVFYNSSSNIYLPY